MSRNPGLPENGGGAQQLPHLAGEGSDARRHASLLVAGITITALLFLALPFMQVASPPVHPPVPYGTSVSLPTPTWVEPVQPPKPEVIEQIKPPELIQDRPKPTIEQLIASVGPRGPGVPYPVADWTIGTVPTEVVEYLDLDRKPNAIHTVAPDVPRGARYSGTVVLEFIVTHRGSVEGIKVISSTDRAFERPAVDAIAKWRFEPGVKDHTPVSTRMRLPIRFNLAN